MKKRLFAIIFALAAALCCIGLFAACSDNGEKSELMTVTFYDGDSVLFTQEAEKGGKAKRPESDPQKDGYILSIGMERLPLRTFMILTVSLTAMFLYLQGLPSTRTTRENIIFWGTGPLSYCTRATGAIFTMKITK